MSESSSNRPNILFITSDQQHWDTLGVSNPKIKTPNLDRLCREGMRFNRAYAPNPTCSPTRASIITGQYPSMHGCWSLGTKLFEDRPTVGEQFNAAGYATHLIGKAHLQPLASEPGMESLECQPTLRDLDFWRDFTGPWYGFQRIEIARNHANEAHAGQHYAIWMEEQGFTEWRDYFDAPPQEDIEPKHNPRGTKEGYGDKEPASWPLPEQYHYTTWTAERTMANIEQAVQDGKPFFTWASFHDPHPPYTVSEPWASMYDPDDMPIGELVDGELDHMPPPHQWTQEPGDVCGPKFKQLQQTFGNHGYHSHLHTEQYMRKNMAVYYGMISFMDQQIGRILDKLDELGVAENTIVVFTTDHGHFLGQHGLIAKGPFHYEDVIRLPFIVRWPGRVAADSESDAIQSLVDIAPTFLAAAGMEAPGFMQGVDQTAVWTGEAERARDHAIVEMRHQPDLLYVKTYVNERYKLTLYRGQPDWGELFDLQEDPDELHSRFDDDAYAGVRAQLMQEWHDAEMAREPTPMPRIAGA